MQSPLVHVKENGGSFDAPLKLLFIHIAKCCCIKIPIHIKNAWVIFSLRHVSHNFNINKKKVMPVI